MASNSIPLTFRAAPLPEGYKADPEQFKNDIVARLYAESTEAISFFASGSIAPSSNVGPWLNNGLTWYVWSDSLAMYIPQPIPQASLGYVAQETEPDHTIYTLWIELDGTGKAQSIQFYSAGAWHDIYEDAFATEAAARVAGDAASVATSEAYTDAAIAGIPSPSNFNSLPARAEGPTTQVITADGTPVTATLSSAPINPGGPGAPFDTGTSEYVAKATGYYMVSVLCQIDNGTAQASTMEIALGTLINGGAGPGGDLDSTPSPNGARWSPGFSVLVELAINDRLAIAISANDGIGVGNVTVSSIAVSFFRVST